MEECNMDAMKLQKINALASELRKHNFAMSSEDAFKQAETVYDGNTTGGAQVLVMEQHPAFTMQQPTQAAAHAPADEMTSRKIELLIESHSKKYEEEFSVLRSAINQLIGELNSVKAHLAKATVVSTSDDSAKHKEKQAELKTEVKEDHPRQGKFQPADVDIQKMFYFGAKR